MRKVCRGFVVFLAAQAAIAGGAAFASDTSAWNWSQLVERVRAEAVEDLPGLLRVIPPEIRANHHLIYDSRSTQAASFADPRIVIFTPDAKWMLAFNGDPSQRGHETAEVIEYDGAAARFRFHRVVFSSEPGVRARVEENARACVGCHRDRPIWISSPRYEGLWAGFYGASMNRPGIEAEADRDHLRAFTARAGEHPVYGFLPLPGKEPLDLVYGRRLEDFDPVIERLNAHRVARRLLEVTRDRPEAAALIGASLASISAYGEPGEWYSDRQSHAAYDFFALFPEPDRERLRARFRAIVKEEAARLNAFIHAEKSRRQVAAGFVPREASETSIDMLNGELDLYRSAKLRLVFEHLRLGIEAAAFSLAAFGRADAPSWSVRFSLQSSSLQQIGEFYVGALVGAGYNWYSTLTPVELAKLSAAAARWAPPDACAARLRAN